MDVLAYKLMNPSSFDRLQSLLRHKGSDFEFSGKQCFRQIYTYDKTPLSGLRLGERFTVRITKLCKPLVSELTGGVCRPAPDMASIEVNGRVFAAKRDESLMRLVQAIESRGGRLHAIAQIDSWYSFENRWPSVLINEPGSQEVERMAVVIELFHRWPVSGKLVVSEMEQRSEIRRIDLLASRLGVSHHEALHAVTLCIPRRSDRLTSFMRRHRSWSGICSVKRAGMATKKDPYIRLYSNTGELLYESAPRRKEYSMLRDCLDMSVAASVESYGDGGGCFLHLCPLGMNTQPKPEPKTEHNPKGESEYERTRTPEVRIVSPESSRKELMSRFTHDASLLLSKAGRIVQALEESCC